MPTKEINAAITELELQLMHYEQLLDTSITNGEVLAKTKVILHNLKEVSRQLNELKRLKDKSSQNYNLLTSD